MPKKSDPRWWAKLPSVAPGHEAATDLCLNCGHCRDRHHAVGNRSCRIPSCAGECTTPAIWVRAEYHGDR